MRLCIGKSTLSLRREEAKSPAQPIRRTCKNKVKIKRCYKLSWTNPVKPTTAIAYKILKNDDGLVLETKSNKSKRLKKRKKSKRLVTIVTNLKPGKKIRYKTIKVDQQTYKLIKRNKDYKPKTKKIWLPKTIRNDYRIKRFFS
jgi:hypothetical protein